MQQDFDFHWNGSASAIIHNLGFGKELQKEAAQIFEEYAQPFMPYKDGALSHNIRITATDTEATITHTVKYAGKQYELVTANRTLTIHSLATDHWYEFAWEQAKDNIERDIDLARLKYRSFNYG